MGEFDYAYFGDLKDDALKEIPWWGFGIFMYVCSLCAVCNMDYTSEYYFLEKGNKERRENFNSSGEARVESTFDQRYTAFIVGQSTRDVAVGTLLPGLSTLEKWYQEGTFGTCHELER